MKPDVVSTKVAVLPHAGCAGVASTVGAGNGVPAAVGDGITAVAVGGTAPTGTGAAPDAAQPTSNIVAIENTINQFIVLLPCVITDILAVLQYWFVTKAAVATPFAG